MNSDNLKSFLQDQYGELFQEKVWNTQSKLYFEALDSKTHPVLGKSRTMVQARQLFSSLILRNLGILKADFVQNQIFEFSEKWPHIFYTDEGYANSMDDLGNLRGPVDLYGQAFVLFGLAHLFEELKEEKFKTMALELINLLKRKRLDSYGGYFELSEDGNRLYLSNPLMHFFEALIKWIEVDQDIVWKECAQGVYNFFKESLCVEKDNKLIVPEHFTEEWEPVIDKEFGDFYFEPGHQYEWAWLIMRYQKATGIGDLLIIKSLIAYSESVGLVKGLLADEVWSSGKIKKSTHRFWPPTERLKALLWYQTLTGDSSYGVPIRETLELILSYFKKSPSVGLHWDYIDENKNYVKQDVFKSSSYYHLFGAFYEFVRLN